MKVAITTIYVLNCLFLMMVVLLQAGRGGGLSIAGGGGSATVFGNRGASTFLQKLTVWSATAFIVLSMVLAHLSSTRSAVETGVFLDPEEIPGVTSTNGASSGEAAPGGAVPIEVVPTEAAPTEAAPSEAVPSEAAPAEVPVEAEQEPGNE